MPRSATLKRTLLTILGAIILLAATARAQEGAAWTDNGWRVSTKYTGAGGGGIGWNDGGYTTLGLFRPWFLAGPGSFDDLVAFVDGRFHLTNDARPVGNLGAGGRLISPAGTLYGANVYYDVDDGHQKTYDQVGLGFEARGRWELLGNLYLPVGTDRYLVGGSPTATTSTSYDNIRYQQFFLVADQSVTTSAFARFESAMTGGDLEVGGALPGLLGNLGIDGYGGFYQFQASGVKDVWGARSRVRAQLTDDTSAQILLTSDNTFGNSAILSLTWTPGEGQRWRRNSLRESAALPVVRQERIVVTEYTVAASTTTQTSAVPLTQPGTGAPITFRHVDSAAAAGGNGSFETPFNALPGTQPADIVLVHGGSVLNGQSYTLAANQRLLGDGAFAPHLVNTNELGTITLPRANALAAQPIVTNAGTVVSVPSGGEVSGLGLNNTDILLNFDALHVSGGVADLNRLDVTSTRIGVTTDTGATVVIRDSRITTLASAGIFADSATLTVRDTTIISGFRGIFFQVSGTLLAQDVTIQSGGDGIFLAPTTTINATVLGSTITGAGTEIVAVDFGPSLGRQWNLNASGNSLDGGAGTIELDTGFAGTGNVTQSAPGTPGGLDAVNGIPTANVTVLGTVNFNQPLPSVP